MGSLKQGISDKRCSSDKQELMDNDIRYQRENRPDEALVYLAKVNDLVEDNEERAEVLLMFGQLMEKKGRFGAAEVYYRNGLSLSPLRSFVLYFLNNNLGYCLNMQQRFREAQRFCETAISIDPRRYNAHKNLGIALQGQGHNFPAARLFTTAIQLNPRDSRALERLEALLQKHPELNSDLTGLSADIEFCRQLVGFKQGRQSGFGRGGYSLGSSDASR